jgi:hypothetical protein
MKLLPLNQTSCRQSDVVFRNARLASGITTIISWACVAFFTYLAIYRRIGSFDLPRALAVFLGLFALLFAWLSGMSWRSSRRPTNWILRLQGNVVLIKFRTYLNWKMSQDDVQVIELHHDEIAFVRKRQERQVSRGMSHETEVDRRVDLEIAMKDLNTTALEKALADERVRPGWGTDRSRTKSLEYPVQAEDGMIRIAWKNKSSRITPNIDRVLEALATIVPVKEESDVAGEFTPGTLAKLNDDEKLKRLAELARTDPLVAIATAKQIFGCSLAEAKEMVDGLGQRSV